jgi:hypothetical protein
MSSTKMIRVPELCVMLVLASAAVMAVPVIQLWRQSEPSRWTGTQTRSGIGVFRTGVLGLTKIREWAGGEPHEKLLITERPALLASASHFDLRSVPDDQLPQSIKNLDVRVRATIDSRGTTAFVKHGIHDIAKWMNAQPSIIIPKMIEMVKQNPCVETWYAGFPFAFASHVRAHVADDTWISLPRAPGSAGWRMPVDFEVQAYDITIMCVPAFANVACLLGVGLLWRSGWRTVRGRWRRARGRCPTCSFPTHKSNRCPECGEMPVSA